MPQVRKIGARLALLVVLLGFAAPAASQDEGFGAVMEGNPFGATNIGSFNPLRCDNDFCGRITGLLFPTLLGVDPERGVLHPSQGNDYILAREWSVSDDGTVYTLRLRNDLVWSDGAPVTAYDVFYSYLAIASDQIASSYTASINASIAGAAPTDDHTIAFVSKNADCTALDALYFPIIPAHVFEPDFADEIVEAGFNRDEHPLDQYDRWLVEQGERDFSFMVNHPFEFVPSVTGGVYELDEVRPTEFIRLESRGGAQGFEYLDVPDSDTQVDLFLSGDLNFIANPLYERRADIRAAGDVRVYEYPGALWYYLGFNLANPFEPASAFDEDRNPLDQGHHPLFGDVRVRRAVQMALDVNTLIEASFFGDGTVMAANQLPGSWAFNNDLAPIGYDPVGAERLLDDAGWRDWNRDGVRECHGCLYADEGAPLSFRLLYNGDNFRFLSLSQLITRQLRQVGIDAFGQPTGGSALNEAVLQQFDAYLAGWFEGYPVNPDQTELFTNAGDVLGEGLNTTSYANERVAELLNSARTVPGCDYEARAGIYREIQAMVQEDQPYAWLFAPNDMAAARGGVIGFNPYPHAPLWNVREWSVVE